jgi:hypothetical protein
MRGSVAGVRRMGEALTVPQRSVLSSRRPRLLLLSATLALGFLVTVGPVATSAAYAPWYSVEQYYLKLVNCTRTGGWVRADGSCAGYGSGRYSSYVRPLAYGPNLSNTVTRPYAKLIAVKNSCSHYANGDTAYRLRLAGYSGSAWGENLACYSVWKNMYSFALWAHRQFQSEKSYNGPHWKNIKNSRYKYIGIGLWRYNSRERLVTDFFAW